jgi:peptide/nickel transport system substrate-binding protein
MMHRQRLLLIFLSFVACTGPKSRRQTNTLVIGIENEIKNLDLRFAADANSAHVSKLLTQGLIEVNDRGEVEGDLALKVTNEGDRVLTFEIATDQQFHNGQALTVHDVKANFDQAAGPKSNIQSSFTDVAAFEVVDSKTFRIRLKSSRPSFLTNEVSAIRIYPKGSELDPQFAQHPIGSGPYRFFQRANRDLIFSKHAPYKRRRNGQLLPNPVYETVIVRSIEDPSTRFLSIIGGDIDVLFNALSPAKVIEARKDPNLAVYVGPGTSYQYLAFNQKHSALKDPRVRRALSLATPREAIVTSKLKGFATLAESMLPLQNQFHSAQLQSTPYNPELARRLLKEAGHEHLSFELKCSTDREVISVLKAVVGAWAEIGVDARLKPLEFATFFSDVSKGQTEAYSLRLTAVLDPDLFFKVFHSTELPPGRNRTYYSNAHLDRLLERGRGASNRPERQKIYNEVQQILQSEGPFVSLWYPSNIVIAQKNIKGLKPWGTGSWIPLFDTFKELRNDSGRH